VELKRNDILLLVPIIFIAGLATGYLLWGGQPSVELVEPTPIALNPTSLPPTSIPPTPIPTQSEAVQRIEVSLDDDPVLGPEDAPITIVEFSDFRCGFCRRFFQETFQPLLDAYPSQIRFVYRDFPVVGGFDAALAAECAHEQGAFWEYHNKLFSGELALGQSAYLQYAEDLDLDIDEITECIESERYADEVNADTQYASDLGVRGTPMFFINGIPLVGAQPLEIFMQIIDGELGE
jgi:protein-disulfide isomerase